MSQSLSNVLLHVIFSTKNRQPFIDEVIEPELYAYISTLAVSNGSYIFKIGGVADHIHLFIHCHGHFQLVTFLSKLRKIHPSG